MSKTFLFQTIQFSTAFVHNQLNAKTVLFRTIQLSTSTQFSSIWPIDKTLSDATTPGHSGLGSDDIEGVLRIPQSSSITGISQSDCLVSYQGYSLGECFTPLPRWSRCILQPLPTGQGKTPATYKCPRCDSKQSSIVGALLTLLPGLLSPGVVVPDWVLSIGKIRGSLNKFPDFFRLDTFIDSTHMKLSSPSK